MRVAVIIVIYNGKDFLDDCFGSLEKIKHEGLDIKFIVVDNGSKDGTAEIVGARWPWVTLLRNEKNLGFAGGNNVGMKEAFNWGADYIYLLNVDTEVTSDFLVEAVRLAESDERIGSAQSLLLLSPERDKINSSGNMIHFLGFGYCRDYRRPVAEKKLTRSPAHNALCAGRSVIASPANGGARQSRSVIARFPKGTGSFTEPSESGRGNHEEIAYASGAGVLYRAAALKKVGLFDEEFFAYHEDLDLGWRLRLAGYKNVLAPRSVVYHKYEFSRSIKKYYWMERNRYLVLLKNLRLWSLAVLAPWLVISEVGLFLAALNGGWWREKFMGYIYFLRPSVWRRLREKRADVAKLRQVSDREIVRLFTSAIDYQEVAGPFTKHIANPLMTFLWSAIKFLIV